MKIARYFLQHVDDETGMDGFVPLWIPRAAGFDPGTSFGLVHDMLEHRLSDQGRFHEELQALGRMTALRGIPGVEMQRSYRPFEARLAMEVGTIWHDLFEAGHGHHEVAPPPPTALDGQAERAIQIIANDCFEHIPQGAKDECDEAAPCWAAKLRKAVTGWMRIGYLDALRRYGSQDQGCWEVGHEAFYWMECNAKRIAQMSEECIPGSVLRLQFDTEELVMTDRLYEPNPDHGMHMQDWLRHRVRHWRTARITNHLGAL